MQSPIAVKFHGVKKYWWPQILKFDTLLIVHHGVASNRKQHSTFSTVVSNYLRDFNRE
jgi:hypothetical protein